jgi:hypothetical protein
LDQEFTRVELTPVIGPEVSAYLVRWWRAALFLIEGLRKTEIRRDGVGFMDGCLSPIGDFAALSFAEALPERIAVLSYLTEVYIVIDGKGRLIPFIVIQNNRITDSSLRL